MFPAFLARLLARFRRVPPRPGPYKLDDREQDGPAWQPTALKTWRCSGFLRPNSVYSDAFAAHAAEQTLPPLVASLPGRPGWAISCAVYSISRGDRDRVEVVLVGTGPPVGDFPAFSPRELTIRVALGGRPLAVVVHPRMEFRG